MNLLQTLVSAVLVARKRKARRNNCYLPPACIEIEACLEVALCTNQNMQCLTIQNHWRCRSSQCKLDMHISDYFFVLFVFHYVSFYLINVISLRTVGEHRIFTRRTMIAIKSHLVNLAQLGTNHYLQLYHYRMKLCKCVGMKFGDKVKR